MENDMRSKDLKHYELDARAAYGIYTHDRAKSWMWYTIEKLIFWEVSL